jgi:hypothetical protein
VERKDEKILTAPLTFVLSRKGREKNTPHPCPLQRGGEERRKMKRFKQCTLTLTLSRGVERGIAGGEKG